MPQQMPQQVPTRVRPQGVMMQEYLAKEPATATERLVAQSSGTTAFKVPTDIEIEKKLSDMEAYLDQLAHQAQGGTQRVRL